jgi:hypothetical protein
MVSSRDSNKLCALALFIQCTLLGITITTGMLCLCILLSGPASGGSLRFKKGVNKKMVACTIVLGVIGILNALVSLFQLVSLQGSLYGKIAYHNDKPETFKLDEADLPKWVAFSGRQETMMVGLVILSVPLYIYFWLRLYRS